MKNETLLAEKVILEGQTLHLHPLKVLYWEEGEILLISDLHLGKAEHFQEAGIPVPKGVSKKNLQNLVEVIDFFQAGKVLFLGDLFHSHHNAGWKDFAQVINKYPEVHFILVRGNHDILQEDYYHSLKIQLTDRLEMPPFVFTHEPIEKEVLNQYNISGHIHPSVWMLGKGRQKIKLPCFYFGQKQGLVPAFGQFTGTFAIRPKKGERVYVITPKKVIVI